MFYLKELRAPSEHVPLTRETQYIRFAHMSILDNNHVYTGTQT